MAEKDWLLGDTPNPLGERVDEIRDQLKRKKPERVAACTGAIFTPTGVNAWQPGQAHSTPP